MAVALLIFCASADAAPYVSCPGGYIAPTLDQCPQWPKHSGPASQPGGGGGGRSGLLGSLLKHLGLGGLL